MLYIVPENPTSPILSIAALCARAGQCGYRIEHDRHGDWSPVDARLDQPLTGLDRVALVEIVRAMETVGATS
jgi:hypothetical protein